jgi:FkbM family methyltransferase
MPFSKAQLAQDLFVISELYDKPDYRFFVEFGACDGIKLSNTWTLEAQLDWPGIVAEPARVWHDQLRKNRSCSIDLRCVTPTSGQSIRFLEVETPELSSAATYADSGDIFSRERLHKSIGYQVESVSLDDLLDCHGAPQNIGYLSIDTEGSEFAILSGFDFSRRTIQVITVEHNYCEPARTNIYDLLTQKGYVRKHEMLSRWDDWYVLG